MIYSTSIDCLSLILDEVVDKIYILLTCRGISILIKKVKIGSKHIQKLTKHELRRVYLHVSDNIYILILVRLTKNFNIPYYRPGY